MRVVVDGPSNLGLRAPKAGVVPGCYKLAGAVRDRGFLGRIGAEDGGCVTPPRYDMHDWKPGDGVFNAAAMASYTVQLADRVAGFVGQGKFVVLLGGECSNLLGPALALKRLGRYGVVYLDGHSDFRTVDNSPYVGAAGGEALALVTGRGQADLTDLGGLGPYTRDSDAVLLGIRADDEYVGDVEKAGIPVWPASKIADDPNAAAQGTLAHLAELDGFWVHLDVDILDAAIMPAVDSPDPGGVDREQLRALLQPLLASPKCVGVDIGIFDPDLDPDGTYATELTDTLVAALS
ncbi:arginase [Kribbella sp. VKM Ac-2569]|uniref:arginase family protein n=1 Tax=Kribbella sp. VKM Ac-2569 TaxID=2512220 RepID=UPI0010D5EBCE|nr:arginase family protein [Kribbella sp. VKM Ac-2569]RZT13565.1 arginase [Kribbella sp. VKM Ac-2569]